jgi:hypothetical protein
MGTRGEQKHHAEERQMGRGGVSVRGQTVEGLRKTWW